MRLITFILIFFLFMSFAATADFYSAMKAYKSQDYAKARREFEQLADLGNARSLHNLGVMAYLGQGQSVDKAGAYAWFRLAFENGYSKSKELMLSVLTEISDTEAQIHYQKLAAHYGVEVLEKKLLPEIRISDKPAGFHFKLEPIKRTHPKYPESAARKRISGYTVVEFDIAEDGRVINPKVIESIPGKVFDKSSIRAIKRWKYAPLLNTKGEPERHQGAMVQLDYYIEGDRGEGYGILARKYKEDAQQGDPGAQYLYGALLSMERKVLNSSMQRKDPAFKPQTISTHWYTQAATAGLPEAQFKLGRNLLFGHECVTDKQKGMLWLVEAASAGNVKAQWLLSRSLLEGKVLDKDEAKALYWMEQAAKQKHVGAIRKLSLSLATGQIAGVQDTEKALSLANQGLNLEKSHPDLLFVKALSHAKSGDMKQAKAHYEDMLDEAEDRDWPTDYYHNLLREQTISF